MESVLSHLPRLRRSPGQAACVLVSLRGGWDTGQLLLVVPAFALRR